MTDSSLQNVGNGAAPNNGESGIVAAISSMSELLVSSITSMKSEMTESGFWFPDSGFRFRVAVSDSGFHILGMPLGNKTHCFPLGQSLIA